MVVVVQKKVCESGLLGPVAGGRLTYPLGAPLGRIAHSFAFTVGGAVCSQGKAAHVGDR